MGVNKMIRIESKNVMELCENCTIAVDNNNIYYVNKFCNDCFEIVKNWTNKSLLTHYKHNQKLINK